MEIESKNIKSSFFLKLLYSTIIAGFTFAIIDFIIDPEMTRAYITDFGLIIVSTIALLIFKRTNKFELPAFIFFSFIIILMTYQSANNDGLFNPYFSLTLISLSSLSPVLLNRKSLYTMYGINVGAIVFMTIYHINVLAGTTREVVADSPLGFGFVYFIL